MYGSSRKKAAPEPPGKAPPKDALAALMDGVEPAKEQLLFESERQPAGSGEPKNREGSLYNDNFYNQRDHWAHGHSARTARGEHDRQPSAAGGTMDNVKSSAARGGVYVKDKTTAGATYLKERDWSREKELAGKAGTATKTGAVYVGSGVAKGAGWLWKSGKNLTGSKPQS